MKDVMRVLRLALVVLGLAFFFAFFLYWGNRNRPMEESSENPEMHSATQPSTSPNTR